MEQNGQRRHKRPRKDPDTSSDDGVLRKPRKTKKSTVASSSSSSDQRSTSKTKHRALANGKARKRDQASASRAPLTTIELSDDDSSDSSSPSDEPLIARRKPQTKRPKNGRGEKGDNATAPTYSSDAEQGLGHWDAQDEAILDSIAHGNFSSGDEAHDIECIVDWRKNKRNGRLEYRVEWTGFSEHHNTWEPPTHFSSPLTERDFWRRMKRLDLGEKPQEPDRSCDEDSCDSESTERLFCSGDSDRVKIAFQRKRQDIRIDRAIKQGNYSSMRGLEEDDESVDAHSVKASEPLQKRQRQGRRRTSNEANKKSPDHERTITPEEGKRQRQASIPSQDESSLPRTEAKALEPLAFEKLRDDQAAERLKQSQRFLMEPHKRRRRQSVSKPNASTVTRHPNDKDTVAPSAISSAPPSARPTAPTGASSALAPGSLPSSNTLTGLPAKPKGKYVNPLDKARTKAALISGSTLPALRKDGQKSAEAIQPKEGREPARKRVSFDGSDDHLASVSRHSASSTELPPMLRPTLGKHASSSRTDQISNKRFVDSGWGEDESLKAVCLPQNESIEQTEMASMEGFFDWDAAAEVAGEDGKDGRGDALKSPPAKEAPSLPHIDSGIQLSHNTPETPRNLCLFFPTDAHSEEEEPCKRGDQHDRRTVERCPPRNERCRDLAFKMVETAFVKAIGSQYHYFSVAREHFDRVPSHKGIRNELIELVRKNGGGLRTREFAISDKMREDENRSVIWVPTAGISFTDVEREAVRRHNFEFRLYDANKTLSEIWPWRQGTITMLSFGALLTKLLLYCQAQITEEGEVASQTRKPPSMGLGLQGETVLLHPWQRVAFKRLLEEDLLGAFLRDVLGILDEEGRCEFALRNSGMDVIEDLFRLEVVAERLVRGAPENAPDSSPTLPNLHLLTMSLDVAVHESLASLQREWCTEKRSFYFCVAHSHMKHDDFRTCFATIDTDGTLRR